MFSKGIVEENGFVGGCIGWGARLVVGSDGEVSQFGHTVAAVPGGGFRGKGTMRE